jgi:hypothetical protein
MKTTKTVTGARNAELRTANATLRLGAECRSEIKWLVGRHITLDSRAASSGSEIVRDLVERAYRRQRKKPRM